MQEDTVYKVMIHLTNGKDIPCMIPPYCKRWITFKEGETYSRTSEEAFAAFENFETAMNFALLVCDKILNVCYKNMGARGVVIRKVYGRHKTTHRELKWVQFFPPYSPDHFDEAIYGRNFICGFVAPVGSVFYKELKIGRIIAGLNPEARDHISINVL
jgi:hypothetical protein